MLTQWSSVCTTVTYWAVLKLQWPAPYGAPSSDLLGLPSVYAGGLTHSWCSSERAPAFATRSWKTASFCRITSGSYCVCSVKVGSARWPSGLPSAYAALRAAFWAGTRWLYVCSVLA